MKVTVVGAGAVGATCADNIVRKEICDELVIVDILEGYAEGKALDLQQCSSLLGFDVHITGTTGDYSRTENSDIVVITAGIPRKPGMTREDLIGTNAGIVKTVADQILKYSPDTILVVVANPMDTMTYHVLKSTGLPKHKVIGMGGALDSARFKTNLQKMLNCSQNDLQATVIGGHGDTTMIPLTRLTTLNNLPITDVLTRDQLDKVIADTMVGGAALTKLLGTSAWYAPGAAATMVLESIVRNKKKIFPCSVYLEGEYGQEDICIGVPVILGKDGWEEIIDLKLNAEEQEKFNQSAAAVRKMNAVLDTL
ncbi:malate dehydrogenase [Taibaiella sp. KBW10]|uniref:malate dehydrogenase n=1 Tax=Taibaiella sp. KBW10 TaxID=2153357 RepID=UPI000F59A769|nr:malate dehydrogenase [Taibaiella sp. KBW10]RQO31631.1 malate dehydrogenase [Taibaiella sp. KBW10]